VELCTEPFYAIIPTLFLCFLLICYPYILLHFWCLHSCSCHFFSSRCMLELKFAICYRAALLSGKCYCFVQKPSWKSHANLMV